MQDIEQKKKKVTKGVKGAKNPSNVVDFPLFSKVTKNLSHLQGPILVFKIISESEHVQEQNNPKFEVIKNWINKTVDERQSVISFIKNSGYQF